MSKVKLYHISKVQIKGMMIPRVPKSDFEDQKIPRICFAPSIQQALIGANEDRDLTGQIFYVYSISTDNYYTPSEDEVADVDLTNEIWVLYPVIPKFEFRIKIIGVDHYISSRINNQMFKVPIWKFNILNYTAKRR